MDPREKEIWERGNEGLEAMIEIFPSCTQFRGLLSGMEEVNRGDLSTEEIRRIDQSITSLLRILTDYLFRIPKSIDIIHYLIAFHGIHLHHFTKLLMCILPYHEEDFFAPVVQQLPLIGTSWDFLPRNNPLSTNRLMRQCSRDYTLLEPIVLYVRQKTAHNKLPIHNEALNFATSLILELIASVPQLNQDLLDHIFPFLEWGLLSRNLRVDTKAASLMVIGMVGRRHLTKQTSEFCVTQIISCAMDHQNNSSKYDDSYWLMWTVTRDRYWLRITLATLANFVQLQSSSWSFPRRLFLRLHKIKGLSGILEKISREFHIVKFLSILLDSFVHGVYSEDLCQVIKSIITDLPLLRLGLIDGLINSIFAKCTDISSPSWYREIVDHINTVYPLQLQVVAKSFLEDDSRFTRTAKQSILVSFLGHDPGIDGAGVVIFEFETEEAILNRLTRISMDDVHTALSSKSIVVASSSEFLDAVLDVVDRFSRRQYWMDLLERGNPDDVVQLTADVVALSLRVAVSSFGKRPDFVQKLISGLSSIQPQVVEAFRRYERSRVDSVFRRGLCSGLEDLFFFLAVTKSREVFKKQLEYRVSEASLCSIRFQSQLITREDVDPLVIIESIKFLTRYCSKGDATKVFAVSPVLLVPLASNNQDVRSAASECVKKLVRVFDDQEGVRGVGDTLNEVEELVRADGPREIYIKRLLRKIAKQSATIVFVNGYFESYLSFLVTYKRGIWKYPVDPDRVLNRIVQMHNVASFLSLDAGDKLLGLLNRPWGNNEGDSDDE